MSMKKTLTFLSLLSLLSLTTFFMLNGCALLHPPKPQVKYVANRPDPSMVELNRIAEKAERSTQVLAEIQVAKASSNITLRGAEQARLAEISTPKGWGRQTSLSFQGPFNKVLYKLALSSGYQYFERGQRPANIKVVTLDARNETLKGILLDTIAQMPEFVTVSVYPASESMIVDYGNGGN